MTRLAVARPRMPAAETLLPYLRRIDAQRCYTNFGPLVAELEARLAERLDLDPACVASVANATAGLTLALRSVAGGRAGVCVLPSWTFVATAHAIAAAGFPPFLVDVDEGSWALTPAIALDAVARIDGPVAAIMPVAPFGAPVDIAGWDRFTALTGIPVVIDAAAGHDGLRAGDTPCVVSLHATKILGAGEGGYVACRRPELAIEIRKRSNFGFYGARDAEVAACNAKMSEYHAAVGLASMDVYAADIARFRSVARHYRERLGGRTDIEWQPGYGTDWCGSTCVARFAGADRDRIAARLDAAGIDSRAWWGSGVHGQTAFAGQPRLPLPTTERLARETIGLPCFVDMGEDEVARVCDVLDGAARVALRKAA
nr:DegT/DnrJ/EryC1/StrS family aminotransferase [Sphingomonas sp. Y57]